MKAEDFVERVYEAGGRLEAKESPNGSHRLYLWTGAGWSKERTQRVKAYLLANELQVYGVLHNEACEGDPMLDVYYGKKIRYGGDFWPSSCPFSLRASWVKEARKRFKRFARWEVPAQGTESRLDKL